MEPLNIAHLILVSAWGGLVLAESVLESVARDEASQRTVARLHLWIDVTCELPVVGAVVATGVLLAMRSPPETAQTWLKIASGLVAVGFNLYCATAVFMRWRTGDDTAAMGAWSRQVRLSLLGVPFGLLALYLGLAHAR